MGCSHAHPGKPIVFDEFFEQGLQDHLSPFLKPKSKQFAKNLELKAAVLSTVLLFGAYVLHYFPNLLPISYLLLVGVYFCAGIPSLIDSIEDICQLEINIDVLMTLAAFSSVLIGSPLEGGLLLVLFSLSEAMEEAVESKAMSAISSLYKLSPTKAYLVEEDGSIHQKSVSDIKIGDQILVKAGEVVALDGIVDQGASSLNLVHLTGESLPVKKEVGDEVPAGGQNMEGSLILTVTHLSGNSTISKIIQLVTEAQESKPRLQKWFDRLSKTYATTIILLSAFFASILPWITSIGYFGMEGSFYRAIAFLIAASPCALIIATPIAYLSALSTCARKGILLKGGVILDAIDHCNAIAFDKTGTLTTGQLTCLGIDPLESESNLPALSIAAALEHHAVHPIAEAVTRLAEKHNIQPLPISEFRYIAGFGVEANVKLTADTNIKAYLGNAEHILDKVPEKTKKLLESKIEDLKKRGLILAVLLAGSELFLLRFEDTLREDMASTMLELKKDRPRKLIMLTGDHEENALRTSKSLPLDEIYASLKPEDKLKHVSSISQKEGLAMVGDGINDAPALARATVGISMGQVGSASAIEASDVVFLQDDLHLLSWLFKKATKTQRIVKQNLILAAGIILMATTPALLGYIPLWMAVVLHEGGTVLVGLNALRLLER